MAEKLLNELRHEISNNVVSATIRAYGQSDQSLCKSLKYSMRVKLLTEHHFEFLSLKGGCNGSSDSTHVKNNVVCATSKASDQPAHRRSLIGAFARRLNIL